jgi:hypothetical protein
MRYLLFVLLCVFCIACKKDDYINIIPADVKSEVASFISEGQKRGVAIDLKGIKIILSNNLIDGNAGYYNPNTHEIFFDTSSNNYKGAPEWKERLIFHELAHAILKRGHKETLLPNTDASSIMTTTPPSANWSGAYLYKREYYIDELFNSNTPIPAWGF